MYHTHCILISAELCILISALLGTACPLLGLLKCAYMPTLLHPESSRAVALFPVAALVEAVTLYLSLTAANNLLCLRRFD